MSIVAPPGTSEHEPNGPIPAATKNSYKQWDLSRGLVQGVVALWMNVLILAVAAATAVTAGFLGDGRWPEQSTWGVGALKLFVLWCLAFLPGWLYIRFLHMRGLALWTEYVLVLHRLERRPAPGRRCGRQPREHLSAEVRGLLRPDHSRPTR